jgi:hypothetical protein
VRGRLCAPAFRESDVRSSPRSVSLFGLSGVSPSRSRTTHHQRSENATSSDR